MSFIQSKDAAIYFEEHGSGSPLILLPGLLGTIEGHWRRFIPDLARRFHVIAVDLRGHGRTNNPSQHIHLHTLVADLFALYETLGIDDASICGYSLGGYVGLAFGIQHPGRVQSLIMHATKFFWTPDAVSSTAREFDPDAIAEKVPHWAEQLRREHTSTDDAHGWKNLLKQAQAFIETMPAEGLSEQALRLANFPVLVTVGDADELIPVGEADRLAAVLPYGMRHVFPATRHPMPKLDKRLFLDIAYSFLNVEPDSEND